MGCHERDCRDTRGPLPQLSPSQLHQLCSCSGCWRGREPARCSLPSPGLSVVWGSAAKPRHHGTGSLGGILSLDKIQQQGAKFTRTIHTPLLTPSPALKTCAGFLYHLRFPGFTWDRAPITIQHGAKDCLWLKLLTGDQQSAARCFCACSPPQAPQQCTCLVMFPLH